VEVPGEEIGWLLTVLAVFLTLRRGTRSVHRPPVGRGHGAVFERRKMWGDRHLARAATDGNLAINGGVGSDGD